MRLFGLIGYPLSHSFSKKYFTEKFEKEGLKDCVYENFPIASIDQLRDILKKPGLEGFNITIPYKEQVIGYLDDSETVVKQIKAMDHGMRIDRTLKCKGVELVVQIEEPEHVLARAMFSIL